jgi:hypothetical protein
MRRYDLNGRGRLGSITGPRMCTGCGGTTEVVVMTPRGFLKSICRPCLKEFSLTHDEFLEGDAFQAIECPECAGALTPSISFLEQGNYLLACDACRHYLRLADLLPYVASLR